ncbi:MAG: acyl-CoA dehydrogenase family protein [Clostridiales bacterium]|nr:acyl-CoA dehydrogenase family protein [Clostridiales bacterium]
MAYLNITEEQQSYVEMVGKFFTKELDPIVQKYDELGKPPMHVIQQGIDMG